MSQTTELTRPFPRRAQAGWSALGRAALLRTWQTGRRALGWPGRVYCAQRLVHELAGLGEHGLRDIGLTRLDLEAASALPLDADPSPLLRQRADERRRRR